MSIHSLEEGGVYRVVRRFEDFHGTVCEPGREFTFLGISHFAKEGGVMLNCTDLRIDFQETASAEMIAGFAGYVEKIGQVPVRPRRAAANGRPGTGGMKWWELIGCVVLLVAAIAIIVTETPRWSGGYIAAWAIVAFALLCLYFEFFDRGKK
jgi:hypothetical protein